ncbi:hypothetical protein KUTeg_018784 [Tegillarca granosa]|uniref:PiggyBac transposable element-derived protein domain-containing protein n=1 Tax=Tegillarca granosa TaxID=220873 RepID=A0ABQ9EG99_TEGGR|nr:hypothetical protein KUTeg_018784 [Tegillarca granosa]
MASNSDRDSDSSSDFDLTDSDSDHSFDSDTDDDDQLTESSIGTLDSQATNIDEEFWRDDLEDVHIDRFEQPQGPRHTLDRDSPVLSYFLLVFPISIFLHLVDQTNLYAQQCGAEIWNPTTLDEMRAFIGLQIIIGINQLPRYTMHWSSNKFIVLLSGFSNM